MQLEKGLGILIIVSISMMCSCRQAEQRKEEPVYPEMEITASDRLLTSHYSATIRGKTDIDIFPQISGYITQVKVVEGEVVQKGQTLFIIDQVPYEAALQIATANVNIAESNVATAQLNFDSKQKLFNKSVVSTFELQTSRNALASAKAQLDLSVAQEVVAKNNLSYTVVKSPSDGVVGTLPFKVGTLVSPNQPQALTQISDNSEMYVYFSMTENQLLTLLREYESVENAIKSMPAIQLQLSDQSIYPEKGRIETISGIIDQTTGSVSLRAVFPNTNRLLHSGGSGNVILPHEKKDCIIVPKSATFEVQDKLFVYKNVNGFAVSTQIQVSPISSDNEYIVEGGLQKGDRIISEGAGFIRENTPLNSKNKE